VPFLDWYNARYAPAYGFPATEMISNRQLWEHYQANPGEFRSDPNNVYRSGVTASKHAEEVISAAYLRGDLSLLDRRLKLVGGVRAEQTNVKGEGPLTDQTRNFQRDAQGAIVMGPGGRPLPIVPATDAFGVSQLTYLERASRAEKEYLRLFPSLNVSYNLRENLIARAAHYTSIGRPDFVQYVGGLTLPDTSQPPGQGNRITVANPGIKAWKARTTNVRLEYYPGGVGQISVGAFRRDFENAFAGGLLKATPEFLAHYGLDEATYGDYDVSTQVNVQGVVRMTGVDFNYKQVLTFLPHWARGLQVFANGSAQRATGPNLGSFSGSNYVPRSGSWGISLTRERFNVRMNWNYRGRSRQAQVAAGRSIEAGTYNWGAPRLYVDVLGEYYFRKRLAVFANLRNIGAVEQDTEVYGPSTPSVARLRLRLDSGSLWTFGVKGSF
jgi:TonB-dependent receptor